MKRKAKLGDMRAQYYIQAREECLMREGSPAFEEEFSHPGFPAGTWRVQDIDICTGGVALLVGCVPLDEAC